MAILVQVSVVHTGSGAGEVAAQSRSPCGQLKQYATLVGLIEMSPRLMK